jgi:hypothetical protein
MTVLDVADMLMPDVPGTVINRVGAYRTEVEARVQNTVFRGFDAVLFDTLTLMFRRMQPICIFQPRLSMCHDLFHPVRRFEIRYWNPTVCAQYCRVLW